MNPGPLMQIRNEIGTRGVKDLTSMRNGISSHSQIRLSQIPFLAQLRCPDFQGCPLAPNLSLLFWCLTAEICLTGLISYESELHLCQPRLYQLQQKRFCHLKESLSYLAFVKCCKSSSPVSHIVSWSLITLSIDNQKGIRNRKKVLCKINNKYGK